MYIKRGVNDVGQITADDVLGGKGRLYGRQLLGEDKALIGTLPGFPDDFGSSIHFIHETILEPGTFTGVHPHEDSEEVYVFIEGKGRMLIDGEIVEIQAGDAVLTKQGSTHNLENTGEIPMRLIVIEGGIE